MESRSVILRFCANKHLKFLINFVGFSRLIHYCTFDYLFYTTEYRNKEDCYECPHYEGRSRMKYIYDIIYHLYEKGNFKEKKKRFRKFHLFIEIWYKLNCEIKKEIINIPNLEHSFFKENARLMKDFGILAKYKILTKYNTVYYNFKLYPHVFNYIYNRSHKIM